MPIPNDDARDSVFVWIDRACESARQWWLLGQPAGEAFRVDWEYEDWFSLTPAQLADLRAQVAGKPEHPRRHEFALIQRQLAGERIVMRFSLLANGPKAWRFNMEPATALYSDKIYHPPHSWGLSNEALEFYDPDAIEAGDPAQSIQNEQHVFVPDIDRLFFGSLGSLATMGLKPGTPRRQDDKWIVEMSGPTRTYLVDLSLKWDEASGRGFILQTRVTKHDQIPGAVGEIERFRGWSKLENFGSNVWAAESVDLIRPNAAAAWRTVRLSGAAVLLDADFEQAVTPPRRGERDVIRGLIADHVIADHRAGKLERVTGSGQDTIVETLPTRAMLDRPSVWRRLGKVALGVLIASTIGLVVGRRLTART